MEYVRIAILDAYDSVQTYMDNNVPTALHYYSDELVEYLKGTAATYSFTAPSKHADSIYLAEGNKLSFRYRDKDYYMNIMHVERDESEVTVEAYSLSFELLNEQRAAYKASSAMSFEEYLAVFDPEHVITLGINEVSEKRITNEWTGEDTILARLFSLATVFSAELEFLPELNDDYSLKRIVMNVYQEHSDTMQGVGQRRTDLTLRYNKEISGITKISDITELYTAIKPIGRDGLTLDKIEKSEYDADGNLEYWKPMNNSNIYAVQARDRFPSNLMAAENERYIGVTWEYDTESTDVLYGQALAQLKKNCVPKVSYEVEGYFDTNIGDTVTIADESFNPELYLEARVTEQHRSFTDPSQNKTTFDNFKELQSQIDESLLSRVEDLIKQNKTYAAMISTDNGIVFRNGVGSTTMTAHVRDAGGVELAENFEIHWYKDGSEAYIGNPYTISADDVDSKAVYRFEAVDTSGIVKTFYEITVSDVNDGEDGSTPEIGDNGNWYIDGEDTGKPSHGQNGDDGPPTGITVSDTEPEKPYTGMLWKHTGTVPGLVQNATYRWNGRSWELYLFVAENLLVESLSALSANLGHVTAGSIVIPWTITDNPQLNVEGTTEFSNSEGGGNPLVMNYTQKNKGDGSVEATGYSKYGYDGITLRVTLPNGVTRETQLTYTALMMSDGDGYVVVEKSDLEKFFTGFYPGGTFSGDLNALITPGMYSCDFSNIANGHYGSGWGWVEVTRSSETSVLQKIYRVPSGGTDEIAIRLLVNNQWGNWFFVPINGDNQWNNISLSSGYVTAEGNTPQYRISGNRVELRGQVARSSGTFGTSTVAIGYLPSDCYPAKTEMFHQADDTYYGARIAITTSGQIRINSRGNSGYVNLSGIYFYTQ